MPPVPRLVDELDRARAYRRLARDLVHALGESGGLQGQAATALPGLVQARGAEPQHRGGLGGESGLAVPGAALADGEPGAPALARCGGGTGRRGADLRPGRDAGRGRGFGSRRPEEVDGEEDWLTA